MCSIVGSFDRQTIVDLCELNAYRGQYSHSVSYYDTINNKFTSISRDFGPVNYNGIDIPDNHYCVVHMQAPTTDAKDTQNIHPAQIGNQLLWHNGIIKFKEVEKLKENYALNSDWDTYILLYHMIENGIPELDGTFSCLFYDDYRMYLFRNEISPMFYDDEMNISSTKFNNSSPTEPNQIILFEPHLKIVQPILSFKTIENPYYFGAL